ncbi:MAG: hypothetical protein WHX52_01670 [Anaerolineae bacterium]
MSSKLGRMMEKWSTRKITIAVVIASIVLAELFVVSTEYFLHRSIQTEPVIRAFVAALVISWSLTRVHAVFTNRLRQTEAALRKSEGENRAILQALPDAIFQLSADGHFLHYHAPTNSDFWRSADEMIGKSI